MTRSSAAYAVLFVAIVSTGCIDTGRKRATIELSVAGTEVSEPFDGRDGVTIELDRADLAFGPLYLCSGFQAGELCDEARAEWTGAAVVDALDPELTPVGTMDAITGTARSWMYDLGIVSLLTQPEPLVTSAAAELGGHSVVLEGRAIVDHTVIPFTAEVAVRQAPGTEQGVPVVRRSPSDPFEYEIEDGDQQLLVRFDPRPWLASVNFRGLLEDRACTSDGPERLCAQDIEQTCASDGTVLEERRCTDLSMVCVRGVGCVEEVRFQEGDQGWRAIRNDVVAGARPEFVWSNDTE